MAEPEPNYLLELWGNNICPNCGKKIPAGTRVGSGKKSDGGFCSLDCYGEYYKAELTERHKRAIAAAERHRNS
ncbi:MAG: hypothetical protein ACHP9V_05520 [Terriglobales bacterium]